MHEDLIKRLRDSEHEIDCSLCDRDCCYPDGKVHCKCIIIEAADAVEAMNYELKSLYKLLGTHPDPRGENGEAGVKCMVLSKTEKTTQEQPSHSPSLGYYYAFLFDETTGETYMPKEET